MTPPHSTPSANSTDEASAFLMGKALHRAFFSTARAAIEMTVSSHNDLAADLESALTAFDKLTGFKQPQVFDEFKCAIDGINLLMDSEAFMEDSETTWLGHELNKGRADLHVERRKRYRQFETTYAGLKRLIRSALSERLCAAFRLGEALEALLLPSTLLSEEPFGSTRADFTLS